MKHAFYLLLSVCAVMTTASVAHAFYDPTVGRFLSMDPIDNNKGESRYTFVEGDPVNKFDPDGRQSVAGFPYEGGQAYANANPAQVNQAYAQYYSQQQQAVVAAVTGTRAQGAGQTLLGLGGMYGGLQLAEASPIKGLSLAYFSTMEASGGLAQFITGQEFPGSLGSLFVAEGGNKKVGAIVDASTLFVDPGSLFDKPSDVSNIFGKIDGYKSIFQAAQDLTEPSSGPANFTDQNLQLPSLNDYNVPVPGFDPNNPLNYNNPRPNKNNCSF
jgi:hypothetical protein